MAEEIGRIEKPPVESFRGGRKLYVVPLVFTGSDAPPDYLEIHERYWRQVNEQIAGQESRVGKITRIYHESLAVSGEAGMKALQAWNSLAYLIIKEKVEQGAALEATEQADLADECMDWERCLLMGFFSRKAAETVSGHYRAAAKQRYEYIGERIAQTLQPGEVAVLFIRESHAVQFPPDIDVFAVAPPALDEIHRWLRDHSRQAEAEEEHEAGSDAK